jgi:hypothetical protein
MLKRLIAYVVSVLRYFFGRKPVEVLRHAKPREIILLPPKQQPFINNKVHPFDDLDNWGHDWTNKPPLAKHEIEDWQKRFDRAFGLNRNGKSCFKLVWNGDRSQWWKYAYDWDSYGKGIKWELRPRILWKKVELGNGDYVDLFPPRWLILMRIEPEQYGRNGKTSPGSGTRNAGSENRSATMKSRKRFGKPSWSLASMTNFAATPLTASALESFETRTIQILIGCTLANRNLRQACKARMRA